MADIQDLQNRILELEEQLEKTLTENNALRKQLNMPKQKIGKSSLRVGRILGSAILKRRFRKSLLKLYDEIPARNVRKETLADVTAHAVWRFTRLGIFALVMAAIPAAMIVLQTILLLRQDKALDRQFTAQMEVLNTQTGLMKTQNEIFSKELEDNKAYEKKNTVLAQLRVIKQDIRGQSSGRKAAKLSGSLENEIQRFTGIDSQFDFIEYGNGLSVLVSNSKGDLLATLVSSNIEKESYDEIFSNSDFSKSGLQQSNMDEAYLQRANLEEAFLISTSFRKGNLKFINFRNAHLENAIFSNAEMNRANLSGAQAQNANFVNTNLRGADLGGANLSGADLREAILAEASLENAVLDGAKVSSPDWLGQLSAEGTLGLETIANTYTVNSKEEKDALKTSYYLIVRK